MFGFEDRAAELKPPTYYHLILFVALFVAGWVDATLV